MKRGKGAHSKEAQQRSYGYSLWSQNAWPSLAYVGEFPVALNLGLFICKMGMVKGVASVNQGCI